MVELSESMIGKGGHPLSASALDALLDVLIDSSHAAKGSTSQRPQAVKAVRQGRFALSGKSVKGKAGAKGPQRPVRNKENTDWTWSVREWLGGLWMRLWWLLS